MTPELAHSLDSNFPHIANSRRGGGGGNNLLNNFYFFSCLRPF